MKEEVEDPRSTGRRRGRAVLVREGLPYWCGSNRDGGVDSHGCGRSPTATDAPGRSGEAGSGYFPGMSQLQVNHKNKNVMDNDPANLQWLCPGCHKKVDSVTEKGVSTKGDEHGYGALDDILDMLDGL